MGSKVGRSTRACALTTFDREGGANLCAYGPHLLPVCPTPYLPALACADDVDVGKVLVAYVNVTDNGKSKAASNKVGRVPQAMSEDRGLLAELPLFFQMYRRVLTAGTRGILLVDLCRELAIANDKKVGRGGWGVGGRTGRAYWAGCWKRCRWLPPSFHSFSLCSFRMLCTQRAQVLNIVEAFKQSGDIRVLTMVRQGPLSQRGVRPHWPARGTLDCRRCAFHLHVSYRAVCIREAVWVGGWLGGWVGGWAGWEGFGSPVAPFFESRAFGLRAACWLLGGDRGPACRHGHSEHSVAELGD